MRKIPLDSPKFRTIENININLHGNACGVKFWNSQAERFSKRPQLRWGNDWVLKLVSKFGVVSNSSRILEIGCGAGNYLSALAPMCREIVGCDFSDKMIFYAQKNAERAGCKNASFIAADWREISPEQLGGPRAFDVSFSHMSAAASKGEGFDKMLELTNDWLVWVQPFSRKDSILDLLRVDVLNRATPNLQDNFSYAFKTLSYLGIPPNLEFRTSVRTDLFNLDCGARFYIGRLSIEKPLSQKEKSKIRACLKSIAKDGKTESRLETILCAMVWSRNGKHSIKI